MMNQFKRIRKSERELAINAGIIRRVTARLADDGHPKSKAVISRTFSGEVKVPDPRVVSALNDELQALGIAASKQNAA